MDANHIVLTLAAPGDVGLHSTWPRCTKFGLGPSDDLRFMFSGHRTSGEIAPWRPQGPDLPGPRGGPIG